MDAHDGQSNIGPHYDKSNVLPLKGCDFTTVVATERTVCMSNSD